MSTITTTARITKDRFNELESEDSLLLIHLIIINRKQVNVFMPLIIRSTTIRLLLEDTRHKDALAGRSDAVIVVGHAKEDEEPVTRLKHRFEDIVRTHVHCKVSAEDCIEVFVLAGDGKHIASMAKEFEKEKKIRSVKLLLV